MTDFRQSQALAEVWVTSDPRARISQLLFEAWVTRLPVATTALLVSQLLAESWSTQQAVRFAVSTALAEVWITTAIAPTWRRYGESAQAV